MFKRTRPFYLIWLIQIFSAINTGWRGCGGGWRGSVTSRLSAWRRTAHASNCVSVSVSPAAHCGRCGRYTSVASPLRLRTWFIDVPRWPARDALSPPNKAHSHATERTRTHPSRTPYLNGTIVSHSFPPDILRRVIRYDTVRLFLQFSRSFFPSGRYCSLVNFFS